MTSGVLSGFLNIFDLNVLLAMIFGVAWGILMGVLPGFGGSIGVSLLIPFTFGMDPHVALPMLAGVYQGSMYGGSITAILVGVPGTSAAAATVYDGFELAKQGQANKALSASIYASTVGGIFGGISLLLIAPLLAKITIMFGPPEYFLLAVCGLTIISTLSRESVFKGALAGLLGLFIGTIGTDPIDGYSRFTFDNPYLYEGIPLIPLILGMFALPRAITFAKSLFVGENKNVGLSYNASTGSLLPLREFFSMWRNWIRSSIIGTIIGIIPAAGANIACFVAYSEAKRNAKDPASFGKGNPEGVIAAESANNAVVGSSLIPLLTLSIPGSPTAAVILGGLMIHGLIPGPQLFAKYGDVTYAFIWAIMLSTIIMLIIALHGARIFAKVVQVPLLVLAPLMIILTLLGSFCVRQLIFDMWITLGMGVLCYFLMNAGFPMPAILLGTILGPMAEKGFRQAMLISNNNYFIFFQRPLSLLLIALALLSIYGSWRMGQARSEI